MKAHLVSNFIAAYWSSYGNTALGVVASWRACCVCVCVCTFWIIQLCASFKVSWSYLLPSNDPEKGRKDTQLKGGVCLKATLSSLYTLLPLTCYRRSAPFDRRQCKMAWITERNLSKAASFHSLIEFLWESSLPPDAQEAIVAEGGHLLPHVDGGHSELDSFQPQNHEEPLAKGTVAHVLTVVSSLKKRRSVIYTISHGQTHSFPVAMAISGPLPTWQTSDFRGERRVPVRDYSLRHFPHQVELQAVTDASVCCHLSFGPSKSRPEFHVLILSYVTLIWLSCAKLRHHCVTLSPSDEIPQISAEVTSLSRVLMK